MIECGKIINTHGVAGEVKIDSFCDEGFFKRIRRVNVCGLEYELSSVRPHKGFVLARIAGIDTVESAMALKGQSVFAERVDIEMPAGRCFYSDMYGFEVFDRRKNAVIGKLASVRENPAAMLLVIDVGGKEALVPDVPAFVRGTDLAARSLEIETIEGMLPDED